MKFGYVRVSTKDQNLARQIEQLKKIPVEKIFSEKESGKNINNRSELLNLLKCIKKNDIVYVTSLDRLGRNADDLTEIIQYIKKKSASLQSLDLPDFSNVPDINLRNMLTDILVTVFKFQAQSEREKIKERQREGIALAKKRDVLYRRPVLYGANSPNPQKRKIYFAIKKDLSNGHSVAELVTKYGISHGTVYRIKKEISKSE